MDSILASITPGASTGVARGGDQERELAAKYRSWAELLDFEFPYVSSVLERVAAGYDDDARREDSHADVRRRLDRLH